MFSHKRKTSRPKAKPSTGNFFSAGNIYPKLTINQPGDKYEQEADTMAERVMTMAEGDHIQRMCPECEMEEKRGLQGDQRLQRQVEPALEPGEEMEEDEEAVQRQSASVEATAGKEEPLMTKAEGGGMTASPALQSRLQSSKGGGAPLPVRTNRFMSRAFGTDFSHVRVHTGQQASEMNESIRAKAFTHGPDTYFKQGQYNPASSEGKKLLAHELTHVVQQQGADLKTVQRQGSGGSSGSTSSFTLNVTPQISWAITALSIRPVREEATWACLGGVAEYDRPRILMNYFIQYQGNSAFEQIDRQKPPNVDRNTYLDSVFTYLWQQIRTPFMAAINRRIARNARFRAKVDRVRAGEGCSRVPFNRRGGQVAV